MPDVPARSAPTSRLLAVLALVLASALVVAGCAASDGTAAAAEADTIVDVRTPAEHAAGHVPGSRNIDVEGSGFADEVAQLPADTTYLVYCRSGNRSARAADIMRQAGLTVVDGGGLDDMRAAGYDISG